VIIRIEDVDSIEFLIKKILVEEKGPTPFPRIPTLREWDHLLLSRYRPFYLPQCDYCCLCGYGKCDLSQGKRGACGIDMRTHQARMHLLSVCIGAATHAAHAAHIIDFLIDKFGRNYPLYISNEIEITTPLITLVTGLKPKTLGDLRTVIEYVAREIMSALSAIHIGQEGSILDFESKAFHIGMMDLIAMEAADIAQVAALRYPKGQENVPFAEIGLGVIDPTKPTVLCIGHNVADGIEIIEYMEKAGYGKPGEKIEVAGLCCTAHEIARESEGTAKIIGPISHQLRFLRLGFADTIVVDEQCISLKLVQEAKRMMSPVLAGTDKAMYGLPDLTELPADEIVKLLVTGRYPGAVILDEEKMGEVATKLAIEMAAIRGKFKRMLSLDDLKKIAQECIGCNLCRQACPIDLPIPEAVRAMAHGDPGLLVNMRDLCLGCARCEEVCPRGIPILTLIEMAYLNVKGQNERFKIRIGRGPIRDVEIRNVGKDIVFGEIPGVIAFAGCATWPRGPADVAKMAREFARRGFIVVASGCAAMAIAMYKNEDGQTPYEEFYDAFDRGCIVNVGPCLANAHIAGAAVKIAAIFGGRQIAANYEEIADYILNRVGACGIVWGIMSQKAKSIITGFNRLGIPVIVGPHGSKYIRALLGDVYDKEKWKVIDMRTGEREYVGPTPSHLMYIAETAEECMVMAVKLCMRPSDTTKGRSIKLMHYIELYKRFFGKLPPDLHLYVRTEADIPMLYRDEVMEYLKEVGWKPLEHVPTDITLLDKVYQKYRRK